MSGFRAWGFTLEVWGLGFGVWVLWFRVYVLGFGILGGWISGLGFSFWVPVAILAQALWPRPTRGRSSVSVLPAA